MCIFDKNSIIENSNSPIVPSYDSVLDAVKGIYGANTNIISQKIVSGGDINEALCLTLDGGEQVFLKSNRRKDVSFFEAEVAGLSMIASTKAIRVPSVLAIGKDKDYGAFLLMEYVEQKLPIKKYWEDFAVQLYEMHEADTSRFIDGESGLYGLHEDNYIGSRKQINKACNSWIAFFRDYRLKVRFKEAEGYFDNAMLKKIEKLLENLDNLLVEPKHPSLIHGDLWSGNAMTGSDGRAWLIDPAVYVGHAEADIAMTELFGGFSGRFYKAYKEASGLDRGYNDRRDIYNLYHLLNHLISFGMSYYGSVKRIVEYYAG